MAAGPLVAQQEDYRSFTLVTSSPFSACGRHGASDNFPDHLPLHSLHSATAEANHCRHLEDAVAGAQMPPDDVLGLRRHLPATELLPLLAHAVQAGHNPAANNLPFRLAEDGRHLDHRTTHRRRAVDRLLVGIEGDVGSIEFGQGIRHVENAAPQPGQWTTPSEHRTVAVPRLCASRRMRSADPGLSRRLLCIPTPI